MMSKIVIKNLLGNLDLRLLTTYINTNSKLDDRGDRYVYNIHCSMGHDDFMAITFRFIMLSVEFVNHGLKRSRGLGGLTIKG